ncbi:Na+/H+ antiporter subunit E [Gephyromycinifex aptenodytis]|uniref:Na+/H+ antiporter subunit E n=1 Tax=Gephyromycinifex aptenodytis TaxID=2716227 RepID=UPI0014463DA8|nr:Na+/H+ antiporter subunit E [Gephyromycinifex aptenodytis]
MRFHPVATAAYAAFVLKEVLVGSAQVARFTVAPAGFPPPAIVELPLRCRSDIEISLMASCITITPGTLVVGTASSRHGAPPTLYVQCILGDSREESLAGLRDMESRLLRATRGRRAEEEGRA